MRPAARFGLIILITSLVLAIVVSLYFLLNEGTINLTMLVLPSIGFIVGIGFMVGGFGTYLGLEDEIENFEHLVGDDIEELAKGNLTYTHLKTAATVVAIVTEIALIFKYQKWLATWWGGVPVIIIAVVCIAIVLYGGVTMNWFQNRQQRTRWWVFALFFIGWAVSAWVGTYYSEPIEFIETARGTETNQISQTPSTNYNTGYRYTRASNWDLAGFDGVSLGSDCEGDDCGAVLLFIVIVVIVVICIIASATIPHFWLVATCLLLSAMVLVTLRELLVVESSWASKKTKV